jgi:hypothetical protein
MKLLPATDKPVLRWTLVALAVGCIWSAARSIQLALGGAYFSGVLAVALWLPLAVGLWRCHPAARVVAKAVLWLIVIIVPFGIVNPFAAMDELGPNPPPVAELLLFWVAPWVIPSLLAIHVLGKYAAEFQRGREAAA